MNIILDTKMVHPHHLQKSMLYECHVEQILDIGQNGYYDEVN